MEILNFEFKARTNKLQELENKLLGLNPELKGVDNQVDTYFNVEKGRLKLREGNIENSLIYYERQNTADAKQSYILLYKHQANASLKQILTAVHGVKVVVSKIRKIYFIENIKFHFDSIENLGTFVEVEAIDETGAVGLEKLKQQCNHFADFFEIQPGDYVSLSYSDLLMDV